MTRPDLMPRAECDAVLAAALTWAANALAGRRMDPHMARQLTRALNRLIVLARRAPRPIDASRTTELFRAMSLTSGDLSHADRGRLWQYLHTAQTVASLVRWDGEVAA